MYARDFWDILRQAVLTVCVLGRLCWASIGTGGEETALPQASMPTIYKTTLIQYDSIYAKMWARSWKNPVPRPR